MSAKGWLTPAELRRLGRAAATLLPLGDAYHVGSSVTTDGTPRDIDLRLMLDTPTYLSLHAEQWRIIADHIGRSIEAETGIHRIDFQIQETAAANRDHKGKIRSAIFALGDQR